MMSLTNRHNLVKTSLVPSLMSVEQFSDDPENEFTRISKQETDLDDIECVVGALIFNQTSDYFHHDLNFLWSASLISIFIHCVIHFQSDIPVCHTNGI